MCSFLRKENWDICRREIYPFVGEAYNDPFFKFLHYNFDAEVMRGSMMEGVVVDLGDQICELSNNICSFKHFRTNKL